MNKILRNILPYSGDEKSVVIRKIVVLVFAVIMFASVCLLIMFYADEGRAEQDYEKIRGVVDFDETEEEDDEDETEKMQLLRSAETLLGMNKDAVGWIKIRDTAVDYPMVQILHNQLGNDYYLYRDFNGEDSRAGSIFLDFRCNFDIVSDGNRVVPNSDNVVIYGHNMKGTAMFGQLRDYYQNPEEFYKAHPVIEVNSNYEKYKFKIFSVFVTNSLPSHGAIFNYYDMIDLPTEDMFYYFADEVKRRSVILNDVDVALGDKFITLSTCSTVFEDARLVVVARMVRDGEDLLEGTQNAKKNPNPLMPDVFYRLSGGKYDEEAEFISYRK